MFVLGTWPGFYRRCERLIAQVPNRRRSEVFWSSLLLLAIACGYLVFTGIAQQRAFAPSYHDEYSYLLQARLITAARLWMTAPVGSEWFESFQVIVKPVYASVYFPGAALVYASALIVNAPPWTAAVVLAGVCVVLLRDIATRLFNPIAGWVAAVMLVGLTIFRLQSLMVMSHIPLLAAGLLMTAFWLRWRSRPTIFLAAMIATTISYAMITRPVDALCFALPVVAAMLWQTARARPFDRPLLQAFRLILIFVGISAPFVTLQAAFSFGVTGSIAESPFTLYASQSYPKTQYGFHRYSESIQPQSALPQKQDYYDQLARPLLRQHTPYGAAEIWLTSRLRTTVLSGLPHPIFLALLPVGLLMLRRLELIVVIAPLAMFPLLYWPYAFFLPHYPLTVVPAVILLALAGVESLTAVAGRWSGAARVGLYVAITSVSIVELPEFNRGNFDEFFRTPQLRTIDRMLEQLPVDERAIVLFRYSPGSNPQEEPVYNIDHADVWHHRIVRAHDLGDRNGEMILQLPASARDRVVYRFDRSNDTLQRLGKVQEVVDNSSADLRR